MNLNRRQLRRLIESVINEEDSKNVEVTISQKIKGTNFVEKLKFSLLSEGKKSRLIINFNSGDTFRGNKIISDKGELNKLKRFIKSLVRGKKDNVTLKCIDGSNLTFESHDGTPGGLVVYEGINQMSTINQVLRKKQLKKDQKKSDGIMTAFTDTNEIAKLTQLYKSL